MKCVRSLFVRYLIALLAITIILLVPTPVSAMLSQLERQLVRRLNVSLPSSFLPSFFSKMNPNSGLKAIPKAMQISTLYRSTNNNAGYKKIINNEIDANFSNKVLLAIGTCGFIGCGIAGSFNPEKQTLTPKTLTANVKDVKTEVKAAEWQVLNSDLKTLSPNLQMPLKKSTQEKFTSEMIKKTFHTQSMQLLLQRLVKLLRHIH